MAAILNLCWLDVLKGPIDEISVTLFRDPENMGVDTKILILQVSDDEIWAKIGGNGSQFEFTLIRSDEKIQWWNNNYQHIPWPWKHGCRHQN